MRVARSYSRIVKLWVARHGFAGDVRRDPTEERNRSLTKEGRATVEAVAKGMRVAGEIPVLILASPYARTLETADIFGKVLDVRVDVLDELAPNFPIADTIARLAEDSEMHRLMIVGHVDNTTPAMEQLGSDDEWPNLLKSEVRRVKIDRKTGEWKLRWQLLPSDVAMPDRA
jgi:phosphohistidine phosphatase SixA